MSGAGFDVASIRTRAARDGDDWVVNGEDLQHHLVGAAADRGRPAVAEQARRPGLLHVVQAGLDGFQA